MAKSDVGTITVYLEAMSKGFDSSLKGASKAVKGFEGSIKQSGMAFTEFQSKIGVATAAIETFAKLTDASMKLAEGDMQGMLDVIKTMPFGIGAAVSAVADLKAEWSGAADELREINAQLDKQKKNNDALAGTMARVGKIRDKTGTLEARAGLVGVDQDTVQFQRASEQGDLRKAAYAEQLKIQQMAQVSKITDGQAESLYNQVTKELEQQLALSEEYWAAMQRVEDAAAEKLRIDNAINTTLADRAKQATQDIADIRSNSKHEIGLMKALGASQSDIDKRRLQAAHKIDKVLESQATHAKNMTFDRPLRQAESLEEIERKRALHAVQTQQGIESSLAGKLAEKKNLENQSPAAVASSFSTAVGQIVLPDARQSGENRRAQLEELKKINGSIAQLNSSLASSRSNYP
jgi:hypothetical protein